MLLLAVIAGVFAMHALTAGDGPGHGMPPTPAIGHHAAADPSSSTNGEPNPLVTATAMAMPPMPAHQDMAACILFLVVGGAAVVLAMLTRRRGSTQADDDELGGRVLPDPRRRGPPASQSHLALSVIRV